jgi:hypothetical protein
VTWGGLRLCLELVDADLTCPALGGTRPSSPSSLLRDGVEEHINAMVETAHAFGLTFIGNHVYNAFAGRELSPEASSADPLWVFAVVASIGSTDVLAPAAWNTLRPDYDIFRASLQGKRLLLKFACDELRELYMLHHAWNYALQVYEARMIELAETDAREWRGATVMWECIYPHTNCPYPNVAPVVAAATKLVKDHLYAHPVATEQTLAEIVDRVCDPVRLTDVIAPAMGQCDTCKFVDGGVLDVLVQVVDDSFVKVLKAEVQGLRRLGR